MPLNKITNWCQNNSEIIFSFDFRGGDFIHRPGLNRSYCKPSWDAMTDMRPYVSDYY